MAEFFGVRHFSPACAFFVTEFLEKHKPEAVLIEGASDMNELIKPLCSPQTHLPAAIMAYTNKAPVRTVLYPFADFSPEYQAMLWALNNNADVIFCDLPAAYLLSEKCSEEKTTEQEKTGEKENEKKEVSVYSRLEQITGVDNDTFWEYNFEFCNSLEEFIPAVEEYGKSLREFSEDDSHNLLREAFMRCRINEAEEKYGKNIAVITGAFHTVGVKLPFSKKDAELTANLPLEDINYTLMPYSYYRLSSLSGYGAGSKAPAYYEILWKNRLYGKLNNSGAEYLSRIAKYQRENGFAASSAEIIEGVRLAETLCVMRNGKAPSLSDLRDSAVTCMGHGHFSEISLACASVEIGTKIGSLPEGTVSTSVQSDFNRQLKELKLERFRKATAEELELDLRENLRVKSEKSAFLDLNRSFFLHRLLVCGIHFGTKSFAGQTNATWKENWSLVWKPEIEIEIVESSLNGDTVEQTASFTLNKKLMESQSLSEAVQVLSSAFECGLTECVKTAALSVRNMAVGNISSIDAGLTIGTLSAIIRFGSIRKLDSELIKPLLSQLFLRFCLQAEDDSICDKTAAEETVKAISSVNDAVDSHDFLDKEKFTNLLENLSDSDKINPLISGFACAVLNEKGNISSEQLSVIINRRLSRGTSSVDGALWFEGFARKNKRSLINRLSVWEKLHEFVCELDNEEFKPVLLCLRRTFADFSPSEKADIAENIGEIMEINPAEASEFIATEITEEEQQNIDELDDFDFGDI